jgi:hypothetical protein
MHKAVGGVQDGRIICSLPEHAQQRLIARRANQFHLDLELGHLPDDHHRKLRRLRPDLKVIELYRYRFLRAIQVKSEQRCGYAPRRAIVEDLDKSLGAGIRGFMGPVEKQVLAEAADAKRPKTPACSAIARFIQSSSLSTISTISCWVNGTRAV